MTAMSRVAVSSLPADGPIAEKQGWRFVLFERFLELARQTIEIMAHSAIELPIECVPALMPAASRLGLMETYGDKSAWTGASERAAGWKWLQMQDKLS